MKNIISIAAILAVGATGTAVAADMAVKAPRAVAPVAVYAWNGFYIGGNVGYGFGQDGTATEAVVSGAGFPIIGGGVPLYGGTNSFNVPARGVIGGVQVGYNWQTASNFVLGLEADIQGSDMKNGVNCVVTCNTPVVTTTASGILPFFPVVFSQDSYSRKIDWFGTVRGRAGIAAGPALLYVTGGLAYGDVERSGSVTGRTISVFAPAGTVNAFSGSYGARETKVGWTVGGGIESKLGANSPWSVKAEYLYVDLGTNRDTFNTVYTTGGGGAVVGTVAGVRVDTSSNRDHVFRFGVNYGFYSPVVARY